MSGIKPATELPWSMPNAQIHDHEIYGGDIDYVVVYSSGVQFAKDAEYIVHAANSLPKLEEQVKVLKEALENIVQRADKSTIGQDIKKIALSSLEGESK